MPGLKHMPQTDKPSAPPPAPPVAGDAGGHPRARAARTPDRRHQRQRVPITTGWLCLLIGLADIIPDAIPGLHVHHGMGRIVASVPGTVTNVASAATVIIGLLLLMLSHGLRRRKRRAWQAVTLLPAFSILSHVVHAPYLAQCAAATAVLA